MVDFTTAIIVHYVYVIPQKAKSFAITYFCVACYSINWIDNIRRHFVYKVSTAEIVSRVNSTCNTAKARGGGENGTKRYNCVRGSSALRIQIRKPFNLKN